MVSQHRGKTVSARRTVQCSDIIGGKLNIVSANMNGKVNPINAQVSSANPTVSRHSWRVRFDPRLNR
jgi:hypothetical protein